MRPRDELFGERSEAHREWGPGLDEDGFGITSDDDVDTFDGFREWVTRITQGPAELWWIVEGGEVLGGIALRAADDERVQRLGHIGYGSGRPPAGEVSRRGLSVKCCVIPLRWGETPW